MASKKKPAPKKRRAKRPDSNATLSKKGEKRGGRNQTRARLKIVDEMLHSSYTHGAITALCSAEWKVSDRQVRKYIQRVYELWAEDAKENPIDRLELRRKQLEGVLEAAMQKNPPNLSAATAALDRLCKVDGLYAEAGVQINSLGGVLVVPPQLKSSEITDLEVIDVEE